MARPRKTETENMEGMSIEAIQEQERSLFVEETESYPSPTPVPPSSAYSNAVPTPVPTKKQVKYEQDAMIPCRSITAGFMNMRGPKTGNVYQWQDVGDVEFVEYQDLQAALVGRSTHLNAPLIVVEDEELLEENVWNRLKSIYATLYSPKDLTEILNLPVGQMGAVIDKLPKSAQESIGIIARTKMENGSLDSIAKIKEIDRVLHTDLMFYLNKE